MPSDVFQELERPCRSEARLIVHDQALWADYLEEADETYASRAARFPDTERVIVEYAPSFQQKFGTDLTDQPATADGEVVRQDLFIVKGDRKVAQFVNFYARDDFAGKTIRACLGNFPELYARGAPVQ